MKRKMNWLKKKYLLLICCFVCASIHAQKIADVPNDLDRYVDSVLKIFEVPGISLAIVKDGKVIVAKGYGVKKLGENSLVTSHTLFSIASNTKAFTAAAL